MASVIPLSVAGDVPGDSMSAEELAAAGRERDLMAQIAAVEAVIGESWATHLPLPEAARHTDAAVRAREILKAWVREAIAAP